MQMQKLLAALSLSAVAVVSARAEQVTVPLSRPGQPVTVEVSLTHGGISVETYGGAEVIVDVTAREKEVEKGRREETRDGLRRLPNSGMGFSVVEKDNVVSVSGQTWKRALDVALRVPVRTSLHLRTVNQGEIKVRGVEGDHELGNTNGPIEALEVAGSVVASSTNGDVRVTMTEVAAGRPMAFSTLNGDIDVTLPASVAADLKLRSTNGDVLTDFDIDLMPVEPQVRRESAGGRFRFSMESETRGRINGGGPEMSFRTFNGDVLLRKGM